MLPPLESLNKDWGGVRELKISYINSKVLHSIRTSSFALFLEAAHLYIINTAKSTALHVPSFDGLAGELLQKLYNLFGEFNALRKLGFLWLTNEK